MEEEFIDAICSLYQSGGNLSPALLQENNMQRWLLLLPSHSPHEALAKACELGVGLEACETCHTTTPMQTQQHMALA